MTKTILIFPFNLLSHYLRCIVFANRYHPNEYRILFQSSEKYDVHVEKHGYQTFNAKHFDTDAVMSGAKNFNFAWLNEANLADILLSQISAIEFYKPDIVIGDVAPTLKMAAEFTGVHYISLLNGYLTKYYSETRQLPISHPLFPYLRLLPVNLRNKLAQFGEKIVFKHIHKPFRNIRKALKLQKLSDYLSETEGDINYICDLPTLFPQRNLPEKFQFIGPLVYQNVAEDESIAQLDEQKPIICVAMGSSGDWNKLVFLNDPYYAKYTIVIAGYSGDLFYAPHLVVRNFLNLEQLLAKSDLMICHGGNGTLYLGIFAKVYMLCVANHFEQEWNIHAIKNYGLGDFASSLSEQQWRERITQGIKQTANFKPLTRFIL